MLFQFFQPRIRVCYFSDPQSSAIYFRDLGDQISYILAPPEDDVSDLIVNRANLPVRLLPEINLDELAGLQPLPAKRIFDKSLATDPALPAETKDLDADNPATDDDDDDHDDDDDVTLVQSHLSQEVLPTECPFSFPYLSSEDASQL